MSEAVVEAERRLALCLEAMRDALQLTVEDALPQSTLLGGAEGVGLDGSGGEVPDTLQQSLEHERAEEVRRVSDQAREVQQRLEVLRRAVVALGGGNPSQPIAAVVPIVDVPVAVLDKEIEALSAESARLGSAMVERYDEARLLAARLEADITSATVPPL